MLYRWAPGTLVSRSMSTTSRAESGPINLRTWVHRTSGTCLKDLSVSPLPQPKHSERHPHRRVLRANARALTASTPLTGHDMHVGESECRIVQELAGSQPWQKSLNTQPCAHPCLTSCWSGSWAQPRLLPSTWDCHPMCFPTLPCHDEQSSKAQNHLVS